MTVLGAALLFVSSTNVSTFGVFFKPIANDLEWSRTAVSGAFSMRMLVMTLLVAPVGYWTDRYGPRAILLPSLVLLGTANLLLARVTELWQFYLVQGLMIGVGASAPFISVASTIARWHENRRGIALGIVATGVGLGSVTLAPLAANLIANTGWRQAAAVLGIIVLAVGVPCSLLIRGFPGSPGPATTSKRGPAKELLNSWMLLPRLTRTPSFAGMALMFFLFTTATYLVTAHFVNYATDTGVSPAVAAAMVAALGIASTAGRLLMGVASDRVGVKASIITCFVPVALALLLVTWRPSTSVLWAAVIMFGFGQGGETPLVPGIVADQYGTKHLASVTAVALTGSLVGAAVGPWMGGFLFDLSESYVLPFGMGICFVIAAIVLASRLRPLTMEDREKFQAAFK